MIIDRLPGCIWLRRLEGKNAIELTRKVADVHFLWKPWLDTTIADNGKEFAVHQAIAKDLIFFFVKNIPFMRERY
jgi:IS30 family transposase